MKKIIFIPGWMNTLGTYQKYEGIEIWKKIKNSSVLDSEYVIAHSMGTLFALKNYNPEKNQKIILVNPLIPKRNILNWFFRWIKFHLKEGLSKNQKIVLNPVLIIVGIYRCVKLLMVDSSKIFELIPEEKLVILRGKNDYFFCDNLAVEFAKLNNIRMIEVENVGHNWNEVYNQEIQKIINQ